MAVLHVQHDDDPERPVRDAVHVVFDGEWPTLRITVTSDAVTFQALDGDIVMRTVRFSHRAMLDRLTE